MSVKRLHRVPTEHDEEVAFHQWCEVNTGRFPELRGMIRIFNEGKRSYGAMNHLRAEGHKKGIPDHFLPVPRRGFHGLWIEMKRVRGRGLEPDQAAWFEYLTAQGYLCVCVRGAAQAAEVVERYLA